MIISHQSDSFWKNLTEHFGVFIQYSVLPYTASTHNTDHLPYVNNLIYAFQPLSNRTIETF